ncbi:MAG: adenosylcobinamide amidohydrolase [Nitrospirae bacterium]|nr:adenosylcobinamide amidohydrolase [Nitrospirota bacterium]MDA8338725.1 adenosylcobinamide amidohydrolase [Nitrospiraceae bacterium]
MRRFLWVLIFLLIPSVVMAGEIPLPQDLNAKASVIKSEKDGLWQKSLVVQFYEKGGFHKGDNVPFVSQRRRVLSTNDGFVDAMAVVNHSAHPELWKNVCQEMKTKHEVGGKVYSRKIKERIAERLGVRNEDIAQMSTAADMDNLAVVTKTFKPFVVTVLVTAGAKTNALRTGLDEGTHIEGEEPKGTVNILILTNARLTDGATARAIVTATEAKTAAFEDLKVPSSYTKNVQATGTGTDSIIVVSGTTGPRVTYTGGHSRIGELIGKAVYEAVVEALGKQNGFKK